MLDEKTVNEYLAELGYASVKDFQASVLYPQYVDGVYGQQTENALISAINVKRNTKNFSVKEFRCECGGKYCCGFPSTLKVEMLRNIQAIRDHYGRPITVTCGLRDKTYNSKLGGSIQNSRHLTGQAVDFYQLGVTDTLANRKASIKWIKTLPNHNYTYGNGINSYGNAVSAPYMGNALHTDVSNGSAPAPSPYDENGKLICDGVGGAATVKEMQRFFSTPQDGVISGQMKTQAKYYPALIAIEYGKNGSPCIRNLQRWIKVTQDGIIGVNTVKAWQNKLIAEKYLASGENDGVFGPVSMKAWQRYLNEHDKAEYPEETIIDKELAVCPVQADWMKNSTYSWESNPTVAKSKKKGTCVTYVACVLQRIGILPSGSYVWHDDGVVYGNNNKMTVTYTRKMPSELKSTLKAGDIIIDGDPHDNGSGSHIFILTGDWIGSYPIIWDNWSGQDGKGAYVYKRNRSLIAIIRLK